MNPTQRRKEPSNGEVLVSLLNPLIKLYLKLMPVFFIYVNQYIIGGFAYLFFCFFKLLEIVRSHLFPSNRKVFPREAPELADSKNKIQ